MNYLMKRACISMLLGVAAATAAVAQAHEIPAGAYECWFQGRARMGLNFRIITGGRYADVENKTGTYAFTSAVDFVFHGGALDSQHAQHKAGSKSVTFISPRGAGLATCDWVK
jgi:hypothetical protein